MKDRKEDILLWLKKFKRIPTTRFVGLLNLNVDAVRKLLNGLEQEGKIIKEEETNSIYWVLKGDEK